jgi:hypothetical protein
LKQLNRVQRELGSARLRGPDALGRPSEPELDNASEGRAYLFTFHYNANDRGSGQSAVTPRYFSAQFWRHHAIDESYGFGNLVSRQVLDSANAIEGSQASTEKRAPVWTGR